MAAWPRRPTAAGGGASGGGAAAEERGLGVAMELVGAKGDAEAPFIGEIRRWGGGGAGGRARRPLMAFKVSRSGVARDSRRPARNDGSGRRAATQKAQGGGSGGAVARRRAARRVYVEQ